MIWLCEPCNPTGRSLLPAAWSSLGQALKACPPVRRPVVAMDRAYEPLRLDGACPVPAEAEALCWQLWSPNKALGATGVRAGCMVAPAADAGGEVQRVHALAPSWVVSGEGVALLQAWHGPDVDAWLGRCRVTLATWRQAQWQTLADLGWQVEPSVTHFFVARPPVGTPPIDELLPWLRGQGLRLRDATSLGLPGHVRLAAQGPEACEALRLALPVVLSERVAPCRSAA